MKVFECKQCVHCERRTWSSSYKPKGYHKIGVVHAYSFCNKYKKRCLEVEHKCEPITGEEKCQDCK